MAKTFARPLPWSTHRCPQKCTDKRQLSKTTTLHRPPLASFRGARAVRRNWLLRNKANRELQRTIRLEQEMEKLAMKKNQVLAGLRQASLVKVPRQASAAGCTPLGGNNLVLPSFFLAKAKANKQRSNPQAHWKDSTSDDWYPLVELQRSSSAL